MCLSFKLLSHVASILELSSGAALLRPWTKRALLKIDKTRTSLFGFRSMTAPIELQKFLFIFRQCLYTSWDDLFVSSCSFSHYN